MEQLFYVHASAQRRHRLGAPDDSSLISSHLISSRLISFHLISSPEQFIRRLNSGQLLLGVYVQKLLYTVYRDVFSGSVPETRWAIDLLLYKVYAATNTCHTHKHTHTHRHADPQTHTHTDRNTNKHEFSRQEVVTKASPGTVAGEPLGQANSKGESRQKEVPKFVAQLLLSRGCRYTHTPLRTRVRSSLKHNPLRRRKTYIPVSN